MTASLIHQMYIAYYQRPADPAGLAYWQAQLTANGGGEAGWNVVAAAFANAAESSALYGTQTLSQKISAIYLAAFERAAVDSEISFWANSGFSEAQIAFAIVNGAQNDDLTTVNNKEAYAVNFVAALDPAGTGVGPFSYEYTDPSIGRTLMGDITKDSDTSAATVNAQVVANVPTLVTVSLTSGADTITPTTNAVENISAALGGSSPNLGRTDQIDGGSASDVMTITTDGNFLLGFSTGYIKNVETINFDTTITSVTTKLINLTGVSGVTTYNVGATKAAVKLSEVSDVGGTINLSGQTTGTFEVAFASGAISGSGSALTIGVSDVGTTGDSVQMLTQGVTDLTVVASGVNNTESFVDLSNSANDYQTISVIGSTDLYIEDIGANASALSASSFAGDLTFTIDSNTNTEIGASGKTITGGAGTDTMRLMGSGIIGASTSSIEELLFDGASGETIVRATGMVGIQTLTFSGQNAANAPSISGLDATARTINAIMDGGSVQTTYSAGGDLTVNLNVDAARIASETITSNTFKLKATNTGAVALNIGSYVSSAGALTLSNATGVSVSVDSTATFNNSIKADLASTITVVGGADIGATISGAAASTISLDVGSGSFNVGSTALTTFALTNSGSVEISSSSRMSGATTITVDTQKMANLSNINTTGLQTLQISGSGTLAAASIGSHTGQANNLTISLTGLGGGFSAGSTAGFAKGTANFTMDASNTEGSLDINKISASGITISTGTIQNFDITTINAGGAFTLDGAASTSSSTSASMNLGGIIASAGVTMSLGAGTGQISAGNIHSDNAISIDASNFGGTLNLPNMTASGVTISLGLNGNVSSAIVDSGKAFTLDGSAAGSSDITLGIVDASSNATISLGSGTGGLSVGTNISAGGSLVIDGSKSSASMDIFNASASGVTVSLGTTGDFSAVSIMAEGGGVTIDGANATSSQLTITTLSSSAAATISLGGGSGAMVVSAIIAESMLTLDGAGNSFDGTMDVTLISASGVTITSGTRGDFSAQAIESNSTFIFDGSIAATAQVALGTLSAVGAITVSMGSGSGALSTTGLEGAGAAVIDASKFGGTLQMARISASGVTISTGTTGHFSASAIISAKAFTLDGSVGTSANTTITTLSVSGAGTISLGTAGSGAVSLGSVDTVGAFTLDANASMATIDINSIRAGSGVSVVSGTLGDFSASAINSTGGGFILDSSKAASASVVINTMSVANVDSAITMGSGAGTFTAGTINSGADFVLDATKSSAAFDLTSISASGVTISLANNADLSSQVIGLAKAFTLDASAAASADITLTNVSASASIGITLGGSATFSAQTMDTVGAFTMTATGANESIDAQNISASGVTINLGLQADISASAIISNTSITIDASGSTTAQGVQLETLDASAGISITMGAGSGSIAMITASAGTTFELSAARFDGDVDISSLRAESGATVTIGSGGNFSASVIGTFAEGFTLNGQSTEASGETITITGISASGMTMNLAAASLVSVEISTADLGAGTFAFSGGSNFNGSLGIVAISGSSMSVVAGENFNMSAASVQLTGAFTLDGAALTSSNITINTISASAGANISLGSMSGSFVVSAFEVKTGDIRISAEGAAGLDMAILSMSASGVQITLGEVSDSASNAMFSASSVDVNNFTLDASAYREQISIDHISAASAITITAGDLTDDLAISALIAETVTINGGTGAHFSASITSATITGSAWSITMPELGDSFAATISYSANWTIKGTGESDNVSVSSTQAAAINNTLDFDFREDTAADTLDIKASVGGTYVILRNFDSSDSDKVKVNHSAGAVSLSTANAAAVIGDILGSTLTSTDLAGVNISAAGTTSLFTYNGDTYYVGQATSTSSLTAFDSGDVVIRFVGNTSVANTDITEQ